MFEKVTAHGTPDFNPFGAEAAAERLARHDKRMKAPEKAKEAIRRYGEAFEQISQEASPMLAMAWLQPVVER